MTFKWHIWLVIDSWSLTAPIRNSVRGRTEFCKITMTSSRRNLHFPTPNPLLIFDRRPPPWHQFLSLASLQLPLKSKMAAMIFVKEILSSRSPKLRLLCRLPIAWYWLLFFNYKWHIPFRKHQMKVIFLRMNSEWHICLVNRLIARADKCQELILKLQKRDLRRSLGLSWPYLILIFNWLGRILKIPLEFKAIWSPNWHPTGVDIFLGFTTFQWNREKKEGWTIVNIDKIKHLSKW